MSKSIFTPKRAVQKVHRTCQKNGWVYRIKKCIFLLTHSETYLFFIQFVYILQGNPHQNCKERQFFKRSFLQLSFAYYDVRREL